MGKWTEEPSKSLASCTHVFINWPHVIEHSGFTIIIRPERVTTQKLHVRGFSPDWDHILATPKPHQVCWKAISISSLKIPMQNITVRKINAFVGILLRSKTILMPDQILLTFNICWLLYDAYHLVSKNLLSNVAGHQRSFKKILIYW